MPGNIPTRLGELLKSGRLADLAEEAGRRRGLTERIRGLLPAEEAAHLVRADTGPAGELVLTMDSAAWASRVRYLGPSLGGQSLRVRVRPRG